MIYEWGWAGLGAGLGVGLGAGLGAGRWALGAGAGRWAALLSVEC